MGDTIDFKTFSVYISRQDEARIQYLVKHGEWASRSEFIRAAVHYALKTDHCPAAMPRAQIDVPLLDKKHRKPRKTKIECEMEQKKIGENPPKEPQKIWDSDAWIARAKEQGML